MAYCSGVFAVVVDVVVDLVVAVFAVDSAVLLLTVLVFVIALLYASVGHAGASGYLAAMALLGIAPEVMKPTALVLNILVASIAAYRFWRVGAFSWSLFWPLALASVPFAFIGGMLHLPSHWYRPVVGAALLFAAVWTAWSSYLSAFPVVRTPPLPGLLISGVLIGFLSGLTGVGGGIFLSPLLLYFAWAETRVVSGVAALFILLNSIAGLLGLLSGGATLPAMIPVLGVAAMAGGAIGAVLGSRLFSPTVIRKVLAVVLVFAGAKMLLV